MKLESKQQPLKYGFNVLFTVVVIGFGVVSYWRGTWVILDSYVYPEDKKKSGWICVIVGECLLLNMSRITRWSFAVAERVWTYVVAFGAVLVWRGIWYLWDDNLEKSAWTSHAVGVGLLLLCGSLRSIIAPPALSLDDGKDDTFDYPMWNLPTSFPKWPLSNKMVSVTSLQDSEP